MQQLVCQVCIADVFKHSGFRHPDVMSDGEPLLNLGEVHLGCLKDKGVEVMCHACAEKTRATTVQGGGGREEPCCRKLSFQRRMPKISDIIGEMTMLNEPDNTFFDVIAYSRVNHDEHR